MVDPTSDLAEDVDQEDAQFCTVCGAAIVDETGHRVVTWIEDGQSLSVHFCDEECEAEWDDSA